MNRVCDKLIRQRQAEIACQSVHGTQRRNELSCYNNSVEDVIPMLKKNTSFATSEPYRHIKADLTAFMQRLQQTEKQTTNDTTTINTLQE